MRQPGDNMKTDWMKTVCVMLLSIAVPGVTHAEVYFGVGASFPNPIYQAWGKAYKVKSNNSLIYTPAAQVRD
jgi:hypothetical protein